MRALLQAVAFIALLPLGTQAQAPVRELYQELNAARVDAQEVYYVRELALRRDVVRISLGEGKLAFLATRDGRVVGAVFTGRGRALVIPRDPTERIAMARFLDAPLLDQSFSEAYLRFNDDTAEELRRQLQQAARAPVEDPAFAEEWNLTAANLNPWHSLRTLMDWISAEPQPYFYAGLRGEASGAFDVLVDQRREEQVLLGQPRWESGVRYYDVWASFPLADTPGPGAGFTPVSYAVETSILPDLSLEGRTTLDLKVARGGDRMVPLELSRFLRVESVADEQGQPLVFFQNEEVSGDELKRRGNDMLHVILPVAPPAGRELRLRVAYRGTVISDAGNRVYFVGERGSWYAHVAGEAWFVPFDLRFRWPARLELVATGKKVDEKQEGEWRSGVWRSEQPIPVAGFNLGEYVSEHIEAGRFKVDVYANRQLEQVVLERFSRPTPMPGSPRVLYPRPGAPPPPARVLMPDAPPPSPAALMKQLGQNIVDAIGFYEKFNGSFPFERLAISQIPGSFGQGWPGLLYLSTLSFLPPEAQQRAGIGARTREQFTELVPYHEVVHQWWGNLVGWAHYRDHWIQEGLANYLTLLYADSRRAGEKMLSNWLEYYAEDLTTADPVTKTTADEAGPLVLGYRLRSSKSPGAYTQVVYGKGAWVFHMLRRMLREPSAKDPDARFLQLIRTLVEEHRHRALTNEGLEHAVQKLMTPAMDLEGSRSMEWFFDQWVRGTGIPRYSVTFSVRAQGETFVVRGKLKQEGVPESFIAPVPLYAARAAGRPVPLGTVVASGKETAFQFTSRVPPRRILIDPEQTLLCVRP